MPVSTKDDISADRRRRRRRVGALAAGLALALGLAACGDDEEDAAPGDGTTTTAEDVTTTVGAGGEGDLTAFCDALVTFDTTLAAGGPEGPDPAAADAALQVVQDNAPEDITEIVDRTAGLAREGFGGNDAIFEDADFIQGEAAVDQYGAANCGFEQVAITGVNYAYEGVSETLPAGQVALTFSNEGTEFHEVALLRINDDVDASVQDLLPETEEEFGALMGQVSIAGVTFAPPDQSSIGFVNLEQGRYALVCFLPVGSTPEAGEEVAENPPHFSEGMVTEVTVE